MHMGCICLSTHRRHGRIAPEKDTMVFMSLRLTLPWLLSTMVRTTRPLAAPLASLRNLGSLKNLTSSHNGLARMSLSRSKESVGDPSSLNRGTAMNLRAVVGGLLRTSTSCVLSESAALGGIFALIACSRLSFNSSSIGLAH